VFFVDVVDADGAVLSTTRVQASSGTGTRGTFDVTIRFTTSGGKGTLVAYALSPKDGSRINEVKTPLVLVR
jgi:germination protein M